MTIAVNALGLPAVAMPVGIHDELPEAVQLIGARDREDLCLSLPDVRTERSSPQGGEADDIDKTGWIRCDRRGRRPAVESPGISTRL